jgi:glyoxylase-like metal-dependent hydrolase (beta-lactamase superfamily II)
MIARNAIRNLDLSKMALLQAGIIPVTPYQQNCTVLFDPDTMEGVIVDPGGDVEIILQTVRENDIKLRAIWLTHGHLDHAGGALELKEALGLEIIGPHKDDLPLLQSLDVARDRLGVDMEVRNVVPDRFLEDGDTVSFGEHVFEVYHTPGHAPGHVIYFNRAQNFAHLGDVLFHRSVGRTDLPGGDADQLLESIRTKVLPLGDDVGFICGHGPGGRIGDERRHNPFIRSIA